MAQIAKWLHETDPSCHVVFIGPCIAKKAETKSTKTKEFVDYTITFEEMQAMFSACDRSGAGASRAGRHAGGIYA